MKPASASALAWLAAIMIGVGCLVGSPLGAGAAFFVAAILAAVPTLFGPGKIRFAAAVFLLISIGLAARNYPELKREQERHRAHRSP